MCDGGDVEPDAGPAAELGELSLDEVRPVVRDDAVGVSEAVDDSFEELDCCWSIQFLARLGLYPLRELGHGHQQVCIAAAGPPQRANHVQPLDGKQPGDRNSLECRSRRMLLRYESLTAVAEPD